MELITPISILDKSNRVLLNNIDRNDYILGIFFAGSTSSINECDGYDYPHARRLGGSRRFEKIE